MGTKIKKGDTVEIITGKEKGKRGKILRVLATADNTRVLVERLNMIKKHMKPSAKNKEGGILEIEGSVDMSNVSIVCPKCSKSSRTGFKLSDNKNVRYCKKCNEIID